MSLPPSKFILPLIVDVSILGLLLTTLIYVSRLAKSNQISYGLKATSFCNAAYPGKEDGYITAPPLSSSTFSLLSDTASNSTWMYYNGAPCYNQDALEATHVNVLHADMGPMFPATSNLVSNALEIQLIVVFSAILMAWNQYKTYTKASNQRTRVQLGSSPTNDGTHPRMSGIPVAPTATDNCFRQSQLLFVSVLTIAIFLISAAVNTNMFFPDVCGHPSFTVPASMTLGESALRKRICTTCEASGCNLAAVAHIHTNPNISFRLVFCLLASCLLLLIIAEPVYFKTMQWYYYKAHSGTNAVPPLVLSPTASNHRRRDLPKYRYRLQIANNYADRHHRGQTRTSAIARGWPYSLSGVTDSIRTFVAKAHAWAAGHPCARDTLTNDNIYPDDANRQHTEVETEPVSPVRGRTVGRSAGRRPPPFGHHVVVDMFSQPQQVDVSSGSSLLADDRVGRPMQLMSIHQLFQILSSKDLFRRRSPRYRVHVDADATMTAIEAEVGEGDDPEYRQKECSVCLLPMPAASRRLPCGHQFHMRCIDRWRAEHDTCPICRNHLL
jgi:hypothetical protein